MSDKQSSSAPTIVWFRRDLRLADHAALRAAIDRKQPVILLYIWSPDEEGDWPPGGASRWWLHHSLCSLRDDITKAGGTLIIRQGDSATILTALAKETNAAAVYYHQRYEPHAIAQEQRVERALAKQGIAVQRFRGHLLHDPHAITTKQGDPYKVFTPFWRTCTDQMEVSEPLPRVTKIDAFRGRRKLSSLTIDDLALLPTIPWDAGLADTWQPGERSAHQRLRTFAKSIVSDYESSRNLPGTDGTSRLSPHLAFGEISPRTIFHTISETMHDLPAARTSGGVFLKELGWREFAYHLLVHFPHTIDQPLDRRFLKFKWSRSTKHERAWQRGMTGFPIVDAGMRQLWHTGWMHNRVRMIVASFLTKDLRMHWLTGARWFWDTLVDADLANNTLGWQWTAGCGADAAPYFRVFNPWAQSQRFDPQGDYLRTWIPELKGLNDKQIHAPAPGSSPVADDSLFSQEPTAKNQQLPRYPAPIVDHAEARDAALDAYRDLGK